MLVGTTVCYFEKVKTAPFVAMSILWKRLVPARRSSLVRCNASSLLGSLRLRFFFFLGFVFSDLDCYYFWFGFIFLWLLYLFVQLHTFFSFFCKNDYTHVVLVYWEQNICSMSCWRYREISFSKWKLINFYICLSKLHKRLIVTWLIGYLIYRKSSLSDN